MRSGTGRGEGGAAGVTRGVVRLLVLLGAVVVVYLVLSVFEHAARADAGSGDHLGGVNPVASVKVTVAEAKKAVSDVKPIIPKSTGAKARSLKNQRPTIKVPKVQAPKVQAPKVQVPKEIRAPKIQIPTKVQTSTISVPRTIKAPKLRVPVKILVTGSGAGATVRRATVGVVRDVVTTTVTSARTAVVQRELPTPARLPALPGLPRAELSALPKLPSAPQFPSFQQLPALPQLPASSSLPGLTQVGHPALPQMSVQKQLPALPRLSAPEQLLDGSQLPALSDGSARVCSLPRTPARDEAGSATSPTKPRPAEPRQPSDRSSSTGQARDSGGGNPPVMGTVSSPWWPEVVAVGRRLVSEFNLRGRTVRYAGPPS